MSALPSRADERRGDSDVRFVPRLCENSDIELARRKFVSITLNKKRTALAVTVENRKERKQFCAFSARARFHTAWTRLGHRAVAVSAGSPALTVDPRDWAMACGPGLWSPRNHLNREDGNESSALPSIRSVMPQSDQAARPDGPDRGQTKFRWTPQIHKPR